MLKIYKKTGVLKTDTLECNKNFKLHDFKVGQLIAVKNHLKGTFDTKFISDFRILIIINKHTLLIQNPDGKTRKININDVKPVPAFTATDNAQQDFKQSMQRKENTHHYNLHSSSM